jgi:hypothetical protein
MWFLIADIAGVDNLGLPGRNGDNGSSANP